MRPLSQSKARWIRSLALKKYREREKRFVVEGSKSIEEFLRRNIYPELILFNRSKRILKPDILSNMQAEQYFAHEKQYASISLLDSSSDALAVFPANFHIETAEEALKYFRNPVFYLDHVQDPGNMGTIIRTLVWFGYNALAVSDGSVDVYHPKVVQASKGALAGIKFYVDEDYQLLSLLSSDRMIYLTSLKGTDLYECSLPSESVFVLGNEANGISPRLQKEGYREISIPGAEGVESLNVAVTAALIIGEYFRLHRKR